MFAAAAGQIWAVKILLSAERGMKTTNFEFMLPAGATALQIAMNNGHIEAA